MLPQTDNLSVFRRSYTLVQFWRLMQQIISEHPACIVAERSASTLLPIQKELERTTLAGNPAPTRESYTFPSHHLKLIQCELVQCTNRLSHVWVWVSVNRESTWLLAQLLFVTPYDLGMTVMPCNILMEDLFRMTWYPWQTGERTCSSKVHIFLQTIISIRRD